MVSSENREDSHSGIPVGILSRLFFYGMLGFFTEVSFTALWYILDSSYNYGLDITWLYLFVVVSHLWPLHACSREDILDIRH